MKVKNDHRSKCSNLSNWKEEKKNSGLQRSPDFFDQEMLVPAITLSVIKPN